MCGGIACDSCSVSYTSLGDMYACDRLAGYAQVGLTLKNDESKVVPDKVNKRIGLKLVLKLESLEEQHPQMASDIDKAIEEMTKFSVEKIATCSSDACNNPPTQSTDVTDSTIQVTSEGNGSDQKHTNVIQIALAVIFNIKMFG